MANKFIYSKEIIKMGIGCSAIILFIAFIIGCLIAHKNRP